LGPFLYCLDQMPRAIRGIIRKASREWHSDANDRRLVPLLSQLYYYSSSARMTDDDEATGDLSLSTCRSSKYCK
jgi:hypothetical protein